MRNFQIKPTYHHHHSHRHHRHHSQHGFMLKRFRLCLKLPQPTPVRCRSLPIGEVDASPTARRQSCVLRDGSGCSVGGARSSSWHFRKPDVYCCLSSHEHIQACILTFARQVVLNRSLPALLHNFGPKAKHPIRSYWRQRPSVDITLQNNV